MTQDLETLRTLPPAAPSGEREAVAVTDAMIGAAWAGYDKRPGYSKPERFRDALQQVLDTFGPLYAHPPAQPAEERAVVNAANHIETAPVPIKRMMPSEVKNRDREIAAEIREMAALDRARTGSEADQYDYTRDPCNQPENIR